MTSPPSDRDPPRLDFAAEVETLPPPPWWARVLRVLRPSHTHSAFSASVLLAASSVASGLVGLARGKYIAWVFGAGPQTDAYMAAFRLPDLMNNFLVGGAVSITFVTILNRYRERGEENEGERLLFTVLNLMVLVLAAASIVLMLFAAPFVRWTNPGFPAAQVAVMLDTTTASVKSALQRARARLEEVAPAADQITEPDIPQARALLDEYIAAFENADAAALERLLVEDVILDRRLGVSSLAIGATAGFLFGSLGINAWGAARERIRFRWEIDLHHPGLRMWLFMTLPLMFGFTLPFLDQYFAGFYASHAAGDITRLANAKQLFSAPMAMLAQAAGVASMPFFAQLWAKDERFEFATGVADSVSRVVALSLLATSAMIALSHPIVELIFGGGRFTPGDVNLTAWFFAFYTLSLLAWSAQAIYARAFYAAGITWLPMLASTIILFVAFPLYGLGYRMWGAAGLALASDAGILLQALTLALLLHKRRMVSLASLDYAEMGRCLLASCAGGAATGLVAWALLALFRHLPRMAQLHHARSLADAAILLAGAAAWTVVTMWVLDRSGSALPRVAMRRLRLG